MKYDIFISYRREGGYDTAQHLYNLLSRDGYKVSFDIDTLRNGDFDKSLFARIDQCKDFILIIDQHAFDRTVDPTFDPNKDWLRQELAYALQKNKNVVPVFLAGVKGFPTNLPADIKPVTMKNGPECVKGHFNMFYKDLKERFLVTPPPSKKVLKIILSAIAVVAIVCFGYIYWPYSTTSVPVDYNDDWEDDVHVEIPAIYDKDLSSDVDDQFNTEVKFCHLATLGENQLTSLIEENYDDYDAEDLGLEDDEQLEQYISLIKSAGTKQFDQIYLNSVTQAAPDAKLNTTYDYQAGNMDWRVYNLKSDKCEHFNAVFRVPDYGNIIFTMSLPVSWMPLKHWRNKHIFESTLDRVTKAYISSMADE